MTKNKIHQFFANLKKAIPNPKTDLNYSSNFELLVAVILSAQATDKSVNQATVKLFAIANTPEKILILGLEELKKHIKIIGLYNTKATNIIKTCEILVEKYTSKIPHTREELMSLPGVGRKSANVILNTAFGEATIGVDTHIFRVANRTGLAQGKTPLEIETQLVKIIPPEFKKSAAHLLVLHGRYICKAKKPMCDICPIIRQCNYFSKKPHLNFSKNAAIIHDNLDKI